MIQLSQLIFDKHALSHFVGKTAQNCISKSPLSIFECFIPRSEIHTVRLASYLSAFLETVSRQGRYFCIYATVLFYVLTGDQFRASELYIIVGLLNALSMHSLLFVALAIKHAVQANVTFRRITVMMSCLI